MKCSSLYLCAFFLSLLISESMVCLAQKRNTRTVTCDFTVRDTVCKNTPVTITNLSLGASTYFWKFCPGTPLSFPSGVNSGPLSGVLHVPAGITLQREGIFFYAFMTIPGDSTIMRITYQNSLLNAPVYDLLNLPGILKGSVFGIQVKNWNGNWYGFVTNGSSLVRLDFGPSLSNLSPAATTVATSPLMNLAQGLVIGNDGTDWVGFCTNFPAATITRFAWGNSLASIPSVYDLGNVGGLTLPMQPALISDTSGWFMFVANTTSLVQLKFGKSLMNTPTGINLGSLQWITDNRGISMFYDCTNPYALLANHNVVLNQLMQVHFKGGLEGAKVVTPLGNTVGLYETTALSEALTISDTIFCLAVNSTPSISLIYFPPCINSVLPISTMFDPSPVIFPNAGTYTIKLIVDEGLPTEQQECKEIEVVEGTVDLGPDTALCDGKVLLLDAGAGFTSYQWNTGATSQTITVISTGTYTVNAFTQAGCLAADSIHIRFDTNSFTTVDTSICFGETYFAGGKLQSATGTYLDTLTAVNGCEHIITTHLIVKPFFQVEIGKDTCVTDTTTVRLIATVPGASTYTWQDGSHDSAITVTAPGLYWVRVTVNNCSQSDSVHITSCPALTYFYLPNAFTPNGDGLNDVFRPIGNDISDFHMIIYNRWGQMVFETTDSLKGWDGTLNGRYCEPGSYPYTITFLAKDSNVSKSKVTGVVILVR
ncbi:MAG: gliding motility-associated C-terminal domain-containing protein [Bacteroidetes bacterium]|nr:gliding motility-associated C-terminal domain-containing protein [Bacteroidota bacterium]